MANVLNVNDLVFLEAEFFQQLAPTEPIYLANAIVHQLQLPQIDELLQRQVNPRYLPMVQDQRLHRLLPVILRVKTLIIISFALFIVTFLDHRPRAESRGHVPHHLTAIT